jgi:hypothetical protein
MAWTTIPSPFFNTCNATITIVRLIVTTTSSDMKANWHSAATFLSWEINRTRHVFYGNNSNDLFSQLLHKTVLFLMTVSRSPTATSTPINNAAAASIKYLFNDVPLHWNNHVGDCFRAFLPKM